jgi:hypothetical protein
MMKLGYEPKRLEQNVVSYSICLLLTFVHRGLFAGVMTGVDAGVVVMVAAMMRIRRGVC